jgi:hypothetical protein
MIQEIVWCDHVRVLAQPLLTTKTPHCYLGKGQVFMIVEQNKVKIVCPNCWKIGTAPPLPIV